MIDNIELFTHSSIRIKDKGKTIYVDPYDMRDEPHDADFILVTHDHYDHFSPDDIAKVEKPDTILVVPEKMEGKAQEVSSLVGRTVSVSPGIYKEIDGMEFETVPAYNNLKPFHPKGAGWVGYIVRLQGQSIYIAGDTSITKEAKDVKCDVAMIPIGGTYTMDAKKAAELINIIRPSVAIPTHYGSVVGKKEDAEAFKGLVKEPVKVEIIMKY